MRRVLNFFSASSLLGGAVWLLQIAPLALTTVLSPSASAVSAVVVELQSPVVGKPFRAQIIPLAASAVPTTENDMGADDDGCVHSSAINVYDNYVVIDPHSYFAACSAEWDDRNGRFVSDLSPDFRAWVLKEFNGELKIDWNQAFEGAGRTALAQGRQPLDRAKFVMEQNQIAPEKKYGNALKCYEKRDARASVMAKVALMAAWCMRARMQVSFADPRLAGGINEVNDKLKREVRDGDKFALDKWLRVYADIFNKARLTNEGYFVAGLTYHGFLVRAGDPRVAEEVLDRMKARFGDDDGNRIAVMLAGLVRSRRRQAQEQSRFLEIAAANFARALYAEEFSRQHIPEMLLVVGECMRRIGKDMEAMDWYLTLAEMAESEPKMREEIRSLGRAPKPDAPFHVQLGWIADQHIATYRKAGLAHPGGGPVGTHKNVLLAVLHQDLGTAKFQNPLWKPATTGNAKDASMLIDLVGKHVIEYQTRFGVWPATLDEMWERGAVRDRNRLNRFHCPATGKRLLYVQPMGALAPKTILIATAEPVETIQGKVHLYYLADNTVETAANPQRPGELFRLR